MAVQLAGQSKFMQRLAISFIFAAIFSPTAVVAEVVEPIKVTWLNPYLPNEWFPVKEFGDPVTAVNTYITFCNTHYGFPKKCTLLAVYPYSAAPDPSKVVPYPDTYWFFDYLSLDGSINQALTIWPIVYCPETATPYGKLKCWRNAPPVTSKKKVVLDPGHGLACSTVGEKIGAVGETDFPANDPPPGRMREDDLTMAIALEAQRQLSAKYNVALTKQNVNDCPTLQERGRIANNENARAFVSIHINAPLLVMGYPVPAPFAHGTSALYNSSKPSSKSLAELMSTAVAQNLGVNNRGAEMRDNLAVLKPTVTRMPAVVLEAARLSSTDEKALHATGSAARIATGIQIAIQAFVGN